MTRKEQIAKAFEAIFENTKRIHGKSEAIDWQKMAIHKCASYVAALPLDLPGDDEIDAMRFAVFDDAINDIEKAERSGYIKGYKNGKKAMRSEIIKCNRQ